MVSEVRQAQAGAKDFSAPLPGIRRIGALVPVTEVGPTGSKTGITLRFFRHEESIIPRPENRLGGSGHAGPGFGEARPIEPQRLAEPTPVFIAPGEVRI